MRTLKPLMRHVGFEWMMVTYWVRSALHADAAVLSGL
jgi:hypothetical protein